MTAALFVLGFFIGWLITLLACGIIVGRVIARGESCGYAGEDAP